MSFQNGQGQASVGRAACRACRAHLVKIVKLIALDGALHGAFLLFLYQYMVTIWEETPIFPGFVWLLLICALYGLGLIPFRFYAGEKMRVYAEGTDCVQKKANYFSYLRIGFIRFLRGLFWGVPFLTGIFLFLYSMDYMPFNEQGLIFKRFAAFFGLGDSVPPGIMVYVGLLLAMLALFLLGWRRDVWMAYLPARTMDYRTLCRTAAKVRGQGRGQLLQNSLWNLLLFMPMAAGALYVLIPYAIDHLRLTGSLQSLLQSVWRFIKTPLPWDVVIGLLLAAIPLYLPFLALRRMRTAVLVCRLTQEGNMGEAEHAAR